MSEGKGRYIFFAVVIHVVGLLFIFGFVSCADSEPALTPKNFAATAGDTKITLTWTMQENTKYELYWSLTSGAGKNGTKLSASITSPYVHTGLTNGTKYYYVLTASNDFGTSSPTTEVSATPDKIISGSRSDFMGAPGYPTSGQAYLSFVGGKTYVNFENFSVIDGPRLHVYLSSSSENADDYVDLGPLKKTTGDQSYGIPSNTNLSQYNNVLIWCVPFDVLFASATLNPLPANN